MDRQFEWGLLNACSMLVQSQDAVNNSTTKSGNSDPPQIYRFPMYNLPCCYTSISDCYLRLQVVHNATYSSVGDRLILAYTVGDSQVIDKL